MKTFTIDRFSMVILIVVVVILYMLVQIRDIATVIFGFTEAIFLMTNEVGFSPRTYPSAIQG